MLDRVPPMLRDLLIALAPALLGWAGTSLVPMLNGINPLYASLAGVVISTAVVYFTKLSTQYGIGSGTTEDEGPRHAV
jgi:hypothetical protein